MRSMYDSDGMIPYAGAIRASTRWKSSRYRHASVRTIGAPVETIKAAEVALDTRTHKERVAAILASSKWQHNFNN